MKYYGSIYKIKNLITNKIYIGQTTKLDPNERIQQHFTKNGKSLVFNSYNKYNKNKDIFEITILCSCFYKIDLDFLESYFISYYNCVSPLGYNLTTGGSYGKHNQETKLRLSKSHAGKRKSEQHKISMSKSRKGFDSENRIKARIQNAKKNGRKIVAKNILTDIEICFESMGMCAKYLNLQGSNISRVLSGRQNRKQHKGWIFNYI